MKKILAKLFKRNDPPLSSRITSDTVAEHRERILAGGRRFKYPIQYARHKLVINAILISVSALIIVIVVGWWQLYPAQNTSDFFYRITKVIPVPVASVDGQPVLYSDYLMKYLSSIHYLEQKEQLSLKTDDGKRQIEYVKQQSMQDAIADAYAIKLAKNMGLSVSDSELQGFLKSQRQSSNGEISEQTYNAVILDYYGWSPSEYSHATANKLLRQKVSYVMDSGAQNVAESITNALKLNPNTDFKTLAASTPSQAGAKAVYGASGWVPKSNQDGGLAIEAAKLIKLHVSSAIKSTIGEGYYIIKLLDINNDQVSYEYIKVPLTAFANSLKNILDAKKVEKYISV
jgi:hypothetical protein